MRADGDEGPAYDTVQHARTVRQGAIMDGATWPSSGLSCGGQPLRSAELIYAALNTNSRPTECRAHAPMVRYFGIVRGPIVAKWCTEYNALQRVAGTVRTPSSAVIGLFFLTRLGIFASTSAACFSSPT